jgi:hypothetical protein
MFGRTRADSALGSTEKGGVAQRCFANFRSGGTVLKIKWAWSLDWAWPHAYSHMNKYI